MLYARAKYRNQRLVRIGNRRIKGLRFVGFYVFYGEIEIARGVAGGVFLGKRLGGLEKFVLFFPGGFRGGLKHLVKIPFF